jgi:hypothetical protein
MAVVRSRKLRIRRPHHAGPLPQVSVCARIDENGFRGIPSCTFALLLNSAIS